MALDMLLVAVLLNTCFVDISDAVCNQARLDICLIPSENTLNIHDFRGNSEDRCTRWSATLNCIQNLQCLKSDATNVSQVFDRNISNFQFEYAYYQALTSSFCTDDGRTALERNFDCYESADEYINNKTERTPGGLSVLCSYVPVVPNDDSHEDPFSTLDEYCSYFDAAIKCYFDTYKKRCNEELARVVTKWQAMFYGNGYGCHISFLESDQSHLHNGSNEADNGTFSGGVEEMSMSQYNAMKSAVIALAVVAFVAITVVIVLIIFLCLNENKRNDKPEFDNRATSHCRSVDTDNNTDLSYQQIDKVTREDESRSYETLS